MFRVISKAKAAILLVNTVFSTILLIWSFISVKKFFEEPIATKITFIKEQQGLYPPMITVCKPDLPPDHFIQLIQNITLTDKIINGKTKMDGLISN